MQRKAGAQQYAQDLASEINACGGWTVEIIHPMFRGELLAGALQSIQIGNTTIHRVGKVAGSRGPSEFYDQKMAETIASFLETNRFDLIHVHTLGQFGVGPLQAALNHGCPVVFTAHDQFLFCEQWFMVERPHLTACSGADPEKCSSCLVGGSAPEALMEQLLDYERMRIGTTRRLAARLDAIWVPSQFMRKMFLKHGFPVHGVYPLGIPTRLPRQKRPSHQLRFAFLGQVQPTKGVHLLFDAWSSLPLGAAQLEIWGECSHSPTRELMNKLCKTRADVRYCGAYSPESLAEIYCNVDVMINPSLAESYSLTVREAIQLGVPVVSSDAGALPEIVRPEFGGITFKNGNHRDLARVLAGIIESPAVVSALGARLPNVMSIADDAIATLARYRDVLTRRIKS
jgi:glycosyltransferase involved in cell wall biosynthesis